MMGGDPDALYRLPRHQQAQVLGWYAATRLPAGYCCNGTGPGGQDGDQQIQMGNSVSSEQRAAFRMTRVDLPQKPPLTVLDLVVDIDDEQRDGLFEELFER